MIKAETPAQVRSSNSVWKFNNKSKKNDELHGICVSKCCSSEPWIGEQARPEALFKWIKWAIYPLLWVIAINLIESLLLAVIPKGIQLPRMPVVDKQFQTKYNTLLMDSVFSLNVDYPYIF